MVTGEPWQPVDVWGLNQEEAIREEVRAKEIKSRHKQLTVYREIISQLCSWNASSLTFVISLHQRSSRLRRWSNDQRKLKKNVDQKRGEPGCYKRPAQSPLDGLQLRLPFPAWCFSASVNTHFSPFWIFRDVIPERSVLCWTLRRTGTPGQLTCSPDPFLPLRPKQLVQKAERSPLHHSQRTESKAEEGQDYRLSKPTSSDLPPARLSLLMAP